MVDFQKIARTIPKVILYIYIYIYIHIFLCFSAVSKKDLTMGQYGGGKKGCFFLKNKVWEVGMVGVPIFGGTSGCLKSLHNRERAEEL